MTVPFFEICFPRDLAAGEKTWKKLKRLSGLEKRPARCSDLLPSIAGHHSHVSEVGFNYKVQTKQIWVNDHRQIVFLRLLEDFHESLGMVVVAVGDHDCIDGLRRNAEQRHVFQQGPGILGYVYQYLSCHRIALGLEKQRYSVLTQVGAFVED
jgi:hypothetical protein